jgi:hypothetical protein
MIYVTGYTIANDNAFGSNFFKWNPTSVSVDNGGTVIKLTGTTTGRYELQYSGAINAKWFGVSTSNTDNGGLINTIIQYASTLPRGANIEYDEGVFNITTPIVQQYPHIKHIGKGILKTVFQTTTDITTMTIGTNPIDNLENVDVIGIGFYHSGSVVKSNPHLLTLGAQQSVFNNWFSGGHYGHVIYGGQGITLDKTFANGNFSVDGSKSAIFLRDAGDAVGYTVGTSVSLPTEVNFNSIYINGPSMNGFENGVNIEAGEHITFSGDSYIGQSTSSNVFLNQTISNRLILEVKFERGVYIDAATVAGIRINGSAGNGSQYIGSVSIDCDIKGQSGDGGRGILVDGTNRVGTFPQVMQNLSITSNVSGHSGNGIEINGGNNITITPKVWGNSFKTINSGNGILIGDGVNTCNINGGHIGGGTFGNGTGNQTNGIAISSLALNIKLNSVDLTGNQNAVSWTPNAGTSGNRIINCAGYNGNLPAISPTVPASTVDFYNPYGTSCSVLIYSGTVTSIKINGSQMFENTVTAPITINAGDIINITYSAAPSWVWWRH